MSNTRNSPVKTSNTHSLAAGRRASNCKVPLIAILTVVKLLAYLSVFVIHDNPFVAAGGNNESCRPCKGVRWDRMKRHTTLETQKKGLNFISISITGYARKQWMEILQAGTREHTCCSKAVS